MTKFTNYTLGTLVALFIGIVVSTFSFGAYSMCDMLKDVGVVLWCVLFCDCLYNLSKTMKEEE